MVEQNVSDHIGQLVKFHTEWKYYETMLSYVVIGIVYTSSRLTIFLTAYKTIYCFSQTSVFSMACQC